MALDFRTQMRSPDYRTPPEILQMLASIPSRQQQIVQGLQPIVAAIPQAVQAYQDQKKKQMFQNAIGQLSGDPRIAAIAPLLQAQPELAGQLLPPIIKGENAPARQQKEMTEIYVDPVTKDISLEPKEGYKKFSVTSEQAVQKTTSQAAQKARTKALEDLVAIRDKGLNLRQIDTYVKNTGLTEGVRTQLQNNNTRGQRALEILQKPNITYEELALGEIDLAGIMQNGSPQLEELRATRFPGWKQSWAALKEKATNTPQEIVPDEIKNKVQEMVQGVIQVDNRVLQANQDLYKTTIGSTIEGSEKQKNKTFFQPGQTMTDVLTGKQSPSGSQKIGRFDVTVSP